MNVTKTKKKNNSLRQFLARKLRKKLRRQKRKAGYLIPKGQNTKQRRAYQELKKKYKDKLQYWDKERRKFYLEYYKPLRYDDPGKTIVIDAPIGVEDNIDYFADVGNALIWGKPSEVHIDIKKCSRVWPSGVMLFCSFYQFTKLRSEGSSKPPKVSSSLSDTDSVTTYLDFCGFHDYVRRTKSNKPHIYHPGDIVKINRESNTNAFISRFDEISALIKQKTDFNSDQVEQFQSMILAEALINVTEHGINYKDVGWYTLTQVHPTSGFISLNIADNGIGIKNSLKTGPQKIDLGNANDEKYLEEAFKLNVSGAFSASTQKKGFLFKSFERGQKRGHGFMYIQDACKDLGIQFTLISDKSYLQFDTNGQLVKRGSRKGTIFAGTLYNLKIPCKKELSND